VTLIDDSIVRGTTSTQLLGLLDEAGAEEIHVRIGSPPIVAPCYLGIDMASREELIAADRSVEDIEADIGADSLAYLSVDAITAALDRDREDLCLGCVTGAYPYDVPDEECNRDVTRSTAGTADD
jgi:amidophosphoribosyltransferase